MVRLLNQLRCPECFSIRLTHDQAVLESSYQKGWVTCEDCGRTMDFVEGVLHAVPQRLSVGAAANSEHYDQEAASKTAGILAHRTHGRNQATKLKWVMDTLGLTQAGPPCAVLEIGPGFGTHGAAVQELGHHYVGMDISVGNLRQALARYPNLAGGHLVAGDAMASPLRDESFDRAYFVAALHHIPDPEVGVREMVRVLRKGGRFCILEPKRFYPVQFVNAMLHPGTEVSAMKMKISAVKAWLRRAGVEDMEVGHCVYTPNGPSALVPFYDAFDSWMSRHAILRHASVMLCVHGRK